MKRNYGIDTLRIVSMVFVILLHLTGIGGICGNSELMSPQFLISQLIRMGTFCAVNCYALISGYVGWSRTPKLSSLLNLWVKVVLFCVVITVATQLRAPEAVGLPDLWKAFTPVREAKYWYFSAYVGLFFFLPLLNHAIRNISGREAVLSVTGLMLIVLWLPYSQIRQVFQMGNGYSALWLMILYIVGGLMSRFEIPSRLPTWSWALGYVLAVAMSFVPRMVKLAMEPELWTPDNQNLSMQYTNFSVILAGVMLVCWFSRMDLPQWMVRITRALSPHAFGVYLCHTHTLVFLTAISGQFAWLGTAPVWKLLVGTFGATGIIYAVGTAMDWVLTWLMKLVRLDRILKKVDRLTTGAK